MQSMIYPSADPLADFAAQDQVDYEAEQKCPVCDNCGHIIAPDEQLFEARIRGKSLILCHHCCGVADWQMIAEIGGVL